MRGQGVSEVHLAPGDAWSAPCPRVYVKRQQSYFCRPLWRLLRRTPTLRRELRGLQACCRLGIPVPPVIWYQEQHGGAELVLAEVPASLPLDQALLEPDADRAAIVRQTAATIARLHRAGWCHGALYPCHILVGAGPDYRVTLIDLEKARHNPLRRHSDLDRFHRHAELTPAEREAFAAAYREGRSRPVEHSVTH